MALSMQFYTIVLTNSISNTAPSDGFVDPNTIQQYYSYNQYAATNYYSSSATPYAFETTPSGLTLGLCQAKRRGNHRWNEIIRNLELISNVYIDPLSIVVTGGSSPGWTPTSLSFTLQSPYGDSVWVTADETTPGAFLSSTLAIQRCIARALIADQFREMDVFDPTSSISVPSTSADVPRYGSRINPASAFEIGAYAGSLTAANATIAVSKITL